MAELASLVIGVIPIVVQALKGYKLAYEKFRGMRRSSREISRIFTMVEIQRQIFTNECRLILRAVVPNEEDVKSMLEDYCDGRWLDEDVEAVVRALFQDNYQCWKDTIEEVLRTLKDLESDLKSFEGQITQAKKVG